MRLFLAALIFLTALPASATVTMQIAFGRALKPNLEELTAQTDVIARDLLGPDCLSLTEGAGLTYRSNAWNLEGAERLSAVAHLMSLWGGGIKFIDTADIPKGIVPSELPAYRPPPSPSLALLSLPLENVVNIFDGAIPKNKKEPGPPVPRYPAGIRSDVVSMNFTVPPLPAPRPTMVASLLLASFAIGATEGFKFASEKRQNENFVIENHTGDGRGVLDYHAWRSISGVGIGTAILSAYYTGKKSPSTMKLIRTLAASALLGYFVYERSFNYVSYNELFPQKPNYKTLGMSIPRSQWFDAAAGLAGLYLITDF